MKENTYKHTLGEDKEHLVSNKEQIDMEVEISKCCQEPVRIAGRTTKWYQCTKCKKVCDVYLI